MRAAQRAMAAFLPEIDWQRFRRRNLNAEVAVHGGGWACCAFGDDAQAVLHLVRTGTRGRGGVVRRDVAPAAARVGVPGLAAGRYRVTAWDTVAGAAVERREVAHGGGCFELDLPPVVADVAVAVRRLEREG
jgi:mannan endo-1,4-beta-mannosidase